MLFYRISIRLQQPRCIRPARGVITCSTPFLASYPHIMPTLRRRVTDGGHFIVTFLHGRGGCATYQITAPGIAYLRSKGIDLQAARVPLSSSLVEAMRQQDFLQTGGGGLAESEEDSRARTLNEARALFTLLTTTPTTAATPQPSVGYPHRGEGGAAAGVASLVFVESAVRVAQASDAWALGIVLPDLPLRLVPGVRGAQQISRIADLAVGVIGGAVRPLMAWWPGRSTPLPVRPMSDDYVLQPEGDWPTELRKQWLPPRIPGLDGGGTLFRAAGLGGHRLTQHAPVDMGEGYVLVRAAPDSPHASDPPSSVRPVRLGSVGEWEAWAVTLGRDSDPETRIWLATIGHSVRQALWAIRVVAPISQPTMEVDTAVVAAGRPCILRIAAPPNACTLPDDPVVTVSAPDGSNNSLEVVGHGYSHRYAVLVPAMRGGYVVAGPGWLRPLRLVVSAPAGDAAPPSASPVNMPLVVTIGGVEGRAFAESPSVLALHAITQSPPGARTPVTDSLAVTVTSPIGRFTVQCGPLEETGSVRHADRENLALTVRALLHAVPPNQVRRLTVDAGPAVGAVTFDVLWAPPTVARPVRLETSRLAQWLAIIDPARKDPRTDPATQQVTRARAAIVKALKRKG
jgi:hypothetical protein